MESRHQLPLLKSLPAVALCCLLLAPGDLGAQSFLTREEALRLCFPEPIRLKRHTLFLTEDQVRTIESRARAALGSKIVTYYTGIDSAGVQGYAFLETHIVRTMPQTLLVHVAPDARIRSVELLAFHEPEDYRAPEPWLDQLDDRRLDDELWLKRGMHNIAGATITAHTTIAAIRKILAIYETAVAGKD